MSENEIPQGRTEEAAAAETPAEEPKHDQPMSFMEHMVELRKRLFRVFLIVCVGTLAAYFFKEDLFNLLMEPLLKVLEPIGGHLQSTGLYETFFTLLKVSLVAGVFGTSPLIFYQFWRFITPGLYAEERRLLAPIAVCSAFFFTGGAMFGYYVVFPFAFDFFASYSSDIIQLTPKVSEYFSFSLKMLLAFGFVFEMPLVIFFLARLGMVSSKWLRKQRKYAILLCFIVAAILTPPDVISQLCMAGPLVALYELSIWVAHFLGKKKPEPPADETPEEA